MIDEVESLLLDGDLLHLNGDYEGAISKYSEALSHSHDFNLINDKVLIKRSDAFMKLRDYNLAVDDCTTIIESIESRDVDKEILLKAFILRATSYEYMGYFSKGLLDINKSLDIHNLPSMSINEILTIRSRLRSLSSCDTKVIEKEGKPSNLVNKETQTLRLIFMKEIPKVITIDKSSMESNKIPVRLSICNEMGLFDRSLLNLLPQLNVSTTIVNLNESSSGKSMISCESSMTSIGPDGRVIYKYILIIVCYVSLILLYI